MSCIWFPVVLKQDWVGKVGGKGYRFCEYADGIHNRKMLQKSVQGILRQYLLCAGTITAADWCQKPWIGFNLRLNKTCWCACLVKTHTHVLWCCVPCSTFFWQTSEELITRHQRGTRNRPLKGSGGNFATFSVSRLALLAAVLSSAVAGGLTIE